jgi:hypothetical protein
MVIGGPSNVFAPNTSAAPFLNNASRGVRILKIHALGNCLDAFVVTNRIYLNRSFAASDDRKARTLGEWLMNADISALFGKRDEAVRKQDAELFLSTQLAEIGFASSEGYLSTKDMATEILHVYGSSDGNAVAFVRETYKPKDKRERSAFVTYFLTDTLNGWKIYRTR